MFTIASYISSSSYIKYILVVSVDIPRCVTEMFFILVNQFM